MNKTLISALMYTLILLLISTLIISLNSNIHAKELSSEKAIENDKIFVSYFQSGNPLEMANIKGITKSQVQHMFDVRQLLVIASIALFILGIILLLLWDKITNRFAIMLSPLLVAWIMIPTLLVTNFTTLFEVFHRVLFPQGNYSFPKTSVLISTYPGEFFATMGCLIGVYFILSTIGLLVIKILSDKLYSLMHSS